MKMYRLVPLTLLLLVFALPQVAYANMAAPANPDVGSSITFQKNDEISVRSEVLDITVDGAQADFMVTYTMVNTTEERVITPSMFLSPNVESGGVQVCIQGEPITFSCICQDGWKPCIQNHPSKDKRKELLNLLNRGCRSPSFR